MVYGRAVALTEAEKAESYDEAQEKKAAAELRNISSAETNRRYQLSFAGFIVTLAMAAGMITKGEEMPRYFRLLLALPLSVWIGLGISARAGI